MCVIDWQLGATFQVHSQQIGEHVLHSQQVIWVVHHHPGLEDLDEDEKGPLRGITATRVPAWCLYWKKQVCKVNSGVYKILP